MGKNKHIRWALLLCGLFLSGAIFTDSTRADTAHKNVTHTVTEKAVIEALISGQLDAIRARDADMAFALTTGLVHDKFDNARAFLSDIRFSYRPLYHHQSFRFLDRSETGNGELVQRVEVTYAQGAPAVVIYRLARNPEGAWAISAFTVLDSSEGQDI